MNKPRTVLQYAIDERIPCQETTIVEQQETIARLTERLKQRETLLAEIRDDFILHFRLLLEVSGNKKEQAFISRWRDRIDDADCYGVSKLIADGDALYVGREVWAISLPESQAGSPEPIPAMLLPENDTPVFRVDCRRLISAGCTGKLDGHACVEIARKALEDTAE